MKNLFMLLTAIISTHFSFGQNFPNPQNFEIEVCYQTDDNECFFEAPEYSYIFRYQFEAPDVTDIESELVGYNIYYENEFLLFTEETDFQTLISGGIGEYYVTALYSEPDGESDSSNIVVLDDSYFPLEINEYKKLGVFVSPNPINSNEKIKINSSIPINKILIFEALGQKIIETKNSTIQLKDQKTGIYFMTIKTSEGSFTEKIIIK